VQDFLKTIPVRRQTATKDASKTLSDIKKILQAYAFARPTVRISFKVLKAKNDKNNWTYAPSPGTNSLLSAAAKIVGQEVAAHCQLKSWGSKEVSTLASGYAVDAVVAKEDAGRMNPHTSGCVLT
jgi:DNA mismatch repair ATPase MutL